MFSDASSVRSRRDRTSEANRRWKGHQSPAIEWPWSTAKSRPLTNWLVCVWWDGGPERRGETVTRRVWLSSGNARRRRPGTAQHVLGVASVVIRIRTRNCLNHLAVSRTTREASTASVGRSLPGSARPYEARRLSFSASVRYPFLLRRSDRSLEFFGKSGKHLAADLRPHSECRRSERRQRKKPPHNAVASLESRGSWWRRIRIR